MKAIDLLRWASYEGVPSEYFSIVNIDEDFDFEMWFGYPCPGNFSGNFFYYYSDCIDHEDIRFPLDNACHKLSEPIKPTFSIDTENFDKYGQEIYIHFYKIDD